MWKYFWFGSINGPRLGDMEGWVVGNFLLEPGWGVRKGVWLEIWNGPQLGELEGFLFGKCDGEGLR